jgi:hypothetical protein
MAGAKEQQDCLFCNLCGSLLDFDSASFASCLLCHNQRSVQGTAPLSPPLEVLSLFDCRVSYSEDIYSLTF